MKDLDYMIHVMGTEGRAYLWFYGNLPIGRPCDLYSKGKREKFLEILKDIEYAINMH